MTAVAADALIGTVVAGRYQVVRRIGKGGMGAVFEVRHVKLGRRFALKTLAADLASDPEALARFQREADVVAQLHHPNIVEVVDWETLADGSPCIVLEFLQGEDLAARIRRGGPLPWPALARIADQILSALAVAHRAGIVHRDIKPHNIFLASDDAGEERAKLLDFGISKMHHAQSAITGDQQLLGTPAHMSPEQVDARPERIGPASDVWAMGTILFEMAAGQPAFRAPSVPALLYQICHGAPQPLAPLRADAPPPFLELVERALSRDPARRIAEAATLRAGLRAALAPVAAGAFVEPMRGDTPMSEPVGPAAAATPWDPGALSTMSRASGQISLSTRVDPSSLSLAPRARRRWLLGGAAVAAAAAVIALLLARGTGDEDPVPTAAAPAIGDERRAEPGPAPATAAGRPAPAPAVDAGVAAPAAAAVDAGAPTPAPTPTMVAVRIDSTPRGAAVLDGKRRLGKTPLRLETRLGVVRTLRLERSGYQPEVIRTDGTRAALKVTLDRKRRPRGPKKDPEAPDVLGPDDIYGRRPR